MPATRQLPASQTPPASPLIITGEMWTARQRQGRRLHEIAYRGCFKPQLPRFFIEQYTRPGDLVYDPFSGRGTTVIEAALLGRCVAANDANPLAAILTRPRLSPPRLATLQTRLEAIDLSGSARADCDLSMFYHPDTESQLVQLRDYLADRQTSAQEDDIDRWIRMVATNRLSGHSSGFFSVYTLPPNLAASPQRQIRINQKRGQIPPPRDIKTLIIKKTKSMLSDLTEDDRKQLQTVAAKAICCTAPADAENALAHNAVRLVVTSPPFLNTVQYAADNWLRCWFNHIDADTVAKTLTLPHSLATWQKVMSLVFARLYRIIAPGGYMAFEVGEIRKGTLKLEDIALPLGRAQGFDCLHILINEQQFTKTSNIWGISNNHHGTNSNRVLVFRKPPTMEC